MPRPTTQHPLPPEVTLEAYLEWRAVRHGVTNPEPMENPVWAWLIDTGHSAYLAASLFPTAPPMNEGALWCFDRFGQSTTELPDGRTVLVGGEHEDHYDPDFAIYNDVVVRHGGGRLEIFGYPVGDFPPTDFHSATLVGDRLVLIGNLGYQHRRRAGYTQVLTLDLATFAVAPVSTSGVSPGWLHRHRAELSSDGAAILVSGGRLHHDDRTMVENIDDWRLELGTWRWQRLTERRWQRWQLTRADEGPNRLWQIEQAARAQRYDRQPVKSDNLAELTRELGAPPDLALWERLFRPSMPHQVQPHEHDSYGVVRLLIDGLTVRTAFDLYEVQVTIEGELPAAKAAALVEEQVEKLSAIEHTRWVAREL